MQRIVEPLPPAWQFPEIASVRITLDGRSFTTPGFRVRRIVKPRPSREGCARGWIEVVDAEERPESAEGPFLPEERHLIDSVTREVALIVGRREAEECESKLQGQLRHADRLATIG